MTAKVGDPALNPWKWPLRISGWDAYGEVVEPVVVPNPGPDLYFWLGEAAEPARGQMITRIVAPKAADYSMRFR